MHQSFMQILGQKYTNSLSHPALCLHVFIWQAALMSFQSLFFTRITSFMHVKYFEEFLTNKRFKYRQTDSERERFKKRERERLSAAYFTLSNNIFFKQKKKSSVLNMTLRFGQSPLPLLCSEGFPVCQSPTGNPKLDVVIDVDFECSFRLQSKLIW